MRIFVLVISIFVLSSLAFAIDTDVIHLKDGSIIKGTIIDTSYTSDMRIENIKIRIMGGSILSFSGDQISRVQKIKDENAQNPQTPMQIKPPIKTKQITHYKSPGVATLLSLVVFPGVGQFYNEESGKGVAFFAGGLIGIAMLIDGSKEEETYDYYSGYTTEEKNPSSATIGAGIYLMSWIFSGIDAYSSAKIINESLALNTTPNGIKLSYRF